MFKNKLSKKFIAILLAFRIRSISIYYSISNFMKENFSLINFILLGTVLVSISILIGSIKNVVYKESQPVIIEKKIEVPKKVDKLVYTSEDKKRAELREAWKYFTEKLTKEELEVEWYNTFKDVKYRYRGYPDKYRYVDDLDAFYFILRKYGYHGTIKSIEETKLIVSQLEKVGLITLKQNYKARFGDVILFNSRKYRSRGHIGIVTDYNKGNIVYLDVNPKIGMGFREYVHYNDRSIDKIFTISLDFWMADYNIEQYKKIKLQVR